MQSNADYAIWHITETAEELAAMLDHPELYADKVRNLKPDSRRLREILAVRCLLKHLFCGQEVDVVYDENGKPSIANTTPLVLPHREPASTPSGNPYLSISHTDGYAAVIVAPTVCSIDIERRGNRVQRVVGHFLTADELAYIALQPDPDLCLHFAWSAKETAYKILGPDYYDLQHLTTVRHIDSAQKRLLLDVKGWDKPMEMLLDYTDEYVLAWCEL